MSEEQKLKQCSTCAYGVSNLEEPRAPWVNFDLGEDYEGYCFFEPPVFTQDYSNGQVVFVRPLVEFSDFCSRWTERG